MPAEPLLYVVKDAKAEADVEEIEDEGAEEAEIASPEATAEFKQQLESWVELNKKVALLKIAIKERVAAQAKLEPHIQEFMTKYGYNNVTTAAAQGEIRMATRSVKSVVKMKDIKKKLVETCGEDILKIFDEGRTVTQRQSLKIVKQRLSMNLQI